MSPIKHLGLYFEINFQDFRLIRLMIFDNDSHVSVVINFYFNAIFKVTLVLVNNARHLLNLLSETPDLFVEISELRN